MRTKIENGRCILGTDMTESLEREFKGLKASYAMVCANISPEFRRECEDALSFLRIKTINDSVLLRRKFRYHMLLHKKHKQSPRSWAKFIGVSSDSGINENDAIMSKILELETEIEKSYYDLKILRFRRQCLARAMKR